MTREGNIFTKEKHTLRENAVVVITKYDPSITEYSQQIRVTAIITSVIDDDTFEAASYALDGFNDIGVNHLTLWVMGSNRDVESYMIDSDNLRRSGIAIDKPQFN